MSPAISLFLDFLRVFAAVGVVLVHSGTTQFAPKWSIDPNAGHHYVVIFFVLSGYVIAHGSYSRQQSAKEYAIARIARLYSVLLPALLVTAVLLSIGRPINPSFYAAFDRGHEPVRFALSLGFINEIWWVSAAPPTNLPLWSLSYEFWYYCLFGVWVYARTRLLATILSLGVAVVAGPKILLLLPVWLAGVVAYRIAARSRVNGNVAVLGLISTTTLATLWFIMDIAFPARIGHPPYYFSNAYASDFVLGALLAGMIFFFHHASGGWRFPQCFELPIRSGAKATFSLYLIHYPLLVFIGATLPYNHWDRVQSGLLLLGILALALLLSRFTESWHKPLAAWLHRRLIVAAP
ncbi:MAG: acyltransferase [Opitutaceae bacterium]